MVAVSSKVSPGYVRKTLADGSLAPRYYVFGKGDTMIGAMADPTIDNVAFMDVARALARGLVKNQYIPAPNPGSVDELILVNWGTTRPIDKPSESHGYRQAQRSMAMQDDAAQQLKTATSNTDKIAAEQKMDDANNQLALSLDEVEDEDVKRENANMKTATILGYDSWWIATASAMDGSPLGRRKQDMMSELEEERYYVVLTAYDYRLLTAKKKSKLLWEARFSIREVSNQFDTGLPKMISVAADFFGRDSKGLNHVDMPEGKVEIGPVKSLGPVPGLGSK
jgi:hypothetical protein